MGISPIILKTQDIAKSIKEIAYKYKIPTSRLDFKLLEYQTFIKTPELNDWSEVDDENKKYIAEEDNLRDERVDVKQAYEIEVFERKPNPIFKYVQFTLGSNKEKSKVVVVFQKGSKLKYSPKVEEILRDEIDKKFLRAGYLKNFFEKKEGLNKLFAKIKVAGAFIFKQDTQVVIAEGIHSQPSIDDNLIKHYEHQAKNVDEYDRIDYSKRGFALAVAKDDVVMEYIKPKSGFNGRDCKGKVILAHEPVEKNKPTFAVSDKIEVKEDDDRILYVAKESGYVAQKEGKFDISDELEVDEINFKKTGSIEAGIDKDVKINVKDQGEYRDAVGIGMSVEAQEVRIEGSIAASAKVKGQIVKIGGQTHQSSKVFGDDIEINVHKGYAKGKKVRVTRVERGIIEADEVVVGQIIGGEIKAKKIHVEIVNSNAKLYAMEEIVIKHLKGEDNSFVIDPMMIGSYHDEIEKIEQSVSNLENDLAKIVEVYEKKKSVYEKSKPMIEQIKHKLVGYKQRGVKPPAAFIHKVRQYQGLNDELNSLNADITLYKNDIAAKYEQLDTIQATVFGAKITCEDSWMGHNEVVFRLITPKGEYKIVPKSHAATFMLKQTDLEEFEIQKKLLYDQE